MKTVSMSGSLRENVGKKDAKKHRREGLVPCVLYGGKDQLHFVVDEGLFKNIVFTPEVCFIKINVGGKEYDAVLQDIQYHPVTDNILHADFLELIPGKSIVMGVPVKITGVSPGVLKGGKLIQKTRKIRIKALPEHMPEDITIDISAMELNDVVKVGDLEKENITLLDNKNTLIVAVRVTRAVEEAPKEGAAAAAAPAAEAKPEAKAAEKKAPEKK